MESRARLLGHPIHQMLIVFPLGLLTTAIIFDVAHLFSGDPLWSIIAYWLTAARELLEETGVLFACDADGRAIDAAGIDACRHDLMQKTSFAEALATKSAGPSRRPLRAPRRSG